MAVRGVGVFVLEDNRERPNECFFFTKRLAAIAASEAVGMVLAPDCFEIGNVLVQR